MPGSGYCGQLGLKKGTPGHREVGGEPGRNISRRIISVKYTEGQVQFFHVCLPSRPKVSCPHGTHFLASGRGLFVSQVHPLTVCTPLTLFSMRALPWLRQSPLQSTSWFLNGLSEARPQRDPGKEWVLWLPAVRGPGPSIPAF